MVKITVMKNNSSFGSWVVGNRWMIVVATVFVVIVSAGGMKHLAFNPDSRVFFSRENPQLAALEEIENTYARNDNIYIAIEPEKGDIFTRETLAALEELTEVSWQVPYSNRVDSIANFQHTEVNGDDLRVSNLVSGAAGLSDAELARIRKIALSDHSLVNSYINPAGDITGVNINVLKPGRALDEVPEVMGFVRQMLGDFGEKYPNLNIYHTGGTPFDFAFSEVSQDDMATLVPVMYVIIIAGIGLLLRSFFSALATLLVIGFSTLTAMGLMGYMGILITSPMTTAPVIIMTLAVADSVHILATMYHEMRSGRSKKEAIVESMRINMKPVFLTSLTTAIGFLSMNASDVPPFRDLGNIVAIGVTAAFLYSILFLPAFMALLPVRARPRIKGSTELCDRLGDFVVRKRKALFWSMSILILAIVSGIYRIELNDNFIEYFDKSYAIRTDTDYLVKKRLTGMDVIEYSIKANEEGGITTPEYLTNLSKLVEWFKSQPDVLQVINFTDVMKRLNRNMHGGDESYYRVPEDRELAAQYLLLYELSLPFGLDLNNHTNVNKSATRVFVILERSSSRRLRELDGQARAWMKMNIPEYMHNYGSGLSVVFAHISKRNIETMAQGISLALLLISGILVIALRSLKYGLISLVPNLFPAFMAFGLWGYIDGQVGLAIAVVAAISLGIVVDDTVHFLIKYLRARRELGMDAGDAVKYSFNTVGTAIIVTSVALAAGFSILTLSGFYVNYSMGVLTAIAIGFALLADFLFLPTLLIQSEGARKR